VIAFAVVDLSPSAVVQYVVAVGSLVVGLYSVWSFES